MKKFLLLACIFGLFADAHAQGKPAAVKPVKVDFAQKIADATPAALPQSPAPDRSSTDAIDNGLKAKVKSVIEYMDQPGKPRETREEQYYGEDGNLIRSVSYMEGYPNSVSVYGYLDNFRVEKLNFVEYLPGERQLNRFTVKGNPLGEVPTKRDTRYSTRYEYRYDTQGRLIETAEYENDGKLVRRQVYSYKPGEKEERSLNEYDVPDWRSVYILDGKGNVKEERWYDKDSDKPDIETYTREYDPQGNWVAERTYDPSKKHAKQPGDLLWTKFRTITYYP